MRGLKPDRATSLNTKKNVASFTDAWIETEQKSKLISEIKSHLLQMRGLKQTGLATDYGGDCVASFTDAWIET